MSKYVEMTHDQVIDACKKYIDEKQVAFVEKAYKFAAKAHKGQKRASGQSYIVHPTQVAGTLAKLGLDRSLQLLLSRSSLIFTLVVLKLPFGEFTLELKP